MQGKASGKDTRWTKQTNPGVNRAQPSLMAPEHCQPAINCDFMLP